MTIAKASSMIISPDDFDPPLKLKRTKATVPGYWTVEELAIELEVTTRNVQYLIKGDPRKKIPVCRLMAYKAGPIFLVPDEEALNYLWLLQEAKRLL